MSERCSGGIGKGWRSVRCGNKAKVERDSKWFCGIHDPVAIGERYAKRVTLYRQRIEAKKNRWKMAERHRIRMEVCEAAFHSPDGREIATEKITEGLVWEMRDALKALSDLAEDGIVPPDLAEANDKARALLAKLED